MEGRLTASKLREDIYRILDQILQTGTPVEVERKGRVLMIIPVHEQPSGRLTALGEHADAVVGDPEDLVHLDWSGEWRP